MLKLRKALLYILDLYLYFLSRMIPKNENIWIFGAWFGNKYADNSKYLFEYVNKYHPSTRAVWLTNSEEIVNELKEKNYEVYKKYSFKSIILGLRAQYSIFVHSNSVDCMPFLNNKKTKLIQLWHGSPIKKIGYDTEIIRKNKSFDNFKYTLFPFLYEKYHLFTAIGNKDSQVYKTAFNKSNIKSLGFARNDNLFKKIKKDKFNILYLPTFRGELGSDIDLLTDYNFNYSEYSKWLNKNNSLLDFKMHPVNKPSREVVLGIQNYQGINFLEEIDVAEILPQTDILITDYSSVYFDYLLTDKPIIFAPFDYESYITKDRELYYDYDEVTPGPKCKNWDEVLHWIEKFKENKNLYKEERERVRNRFHKYQDGKSCERVYKEITQLVMK